MIQNNSTTTKPKITGKGIAITLLAWLIYTLLSTALLVSSEPVPFIGAFISMGLSSSLAGVLMLPSWYLIVRGMHHKSWWAKTVAHLIAGTAVVFTWYYLYLGLFDLLFGRELLGPQFTDNKGWIMLSTFMIYLITFAVIHTIESLKQMRTKEKQAAELKELSRRQEIATLKAQLNPHFLFNTLNSINAMVTKDPAATRQMIANLSEMLRYSLDSFEKEHVSIEDEVQFAKTYLQLEQQRLGDRLNVTYNVDDSVLDLPVPPMILQPLVENAVKHGIAPLEDGGHISITVRRRDDVVRFTVKDTGRGMPPDSKTGGIGLRNTNRMLVKRFGERHKVQIKSEHAEGTEVSFSIPLNHYA